MNGSAVNSFSSASGYIWAICVTYNDGAGNLGAPSAGLLILFITVSSEVLIGVPLNSWLICHILRKRSKDASILPADFFPLNLAIAHLTFYLIVPLMFINHFLWWSEKVLGLTTYLTGMGLIMKPVLLCLVCVERYIAVVRPLDYLRFKSPQYKWGCLGVSWCIYFVLATTAFLGRSIVPVCVLFLPVLVIDTFCCLSVLKTLQKPPPGDIEMVEKEKEKKKKKKEKRKEKQTCSGVMSPGERNEKRAKKVERGGKGEMNSMKRKAFTTITIIQVVLTLNYLPYIITMPLEGRVPAQTMLCQYVAIAMAAAVTCSYLQPLLYLHRLRRLPCMTPQTK